MIPFDSNLKVLATKLNKPLYAVGGYVRNFILNGEISVDIDLCSNIGVEELRKTLDENGFKVVAEYKRTGTVVFTDGNQKYEYTQFRTDSYIDGNHRPDHVNFTDDINLDAKRRDFKCNAVYYDIAGDKIVDPLNGQNDIKNRILDTVDAPDRVFADDGLRLMRLARFCGELDFKPTNEVIISAKKYARNIRDISVERIYDELKKILVADTKYSFSNKRGHYAGIKLLDEIGVLELLFPTLTMGKNMKQRSDYHNHDVFTHSLKCLLYSSPKIRLASLLHDIGKPIVMNKTGKYHNHDKEGVAIAREILNRLKADKKTVEKTLFLVKYHMLDIDGKTKEGKIRKFIIDNQNYIEDLLFLKQADYSACKDHMNVCPTVKKWLDIIENMKIEKVPLSFKDLKVSAKDIVAMGFRDKQIGMEQKRIFNLVVDNPALNTKEELTRILRRDFDKQK